MIGSVRAVAAVAALAVAVTGCGVDEEKEAPVSYACKTLTADQVVVESGFPVDFAQRGITVTQVGERVCDARMFLLTFHLGGTRAAFDRLARDMGLAPALGATTSIGGTPVPPKPEPGRYRDRITTASLGNLDRTLELSVPLAQLPLTDTSALHGEYVLGA
ncbi:hypothetical protein AXK57_21485 [Tsukamurella pulmonis]|uniref:hypothetical protein n=1 Tax=Tsukamurella pulmonis TaxID=47312 RepID=UPI00079B3CC3|nr:hypothetical protein [Tsukamurella pulmonis]KXP11821.1 hypothetical protein AXK57_21485 [Tsukamurella pulmonis]RDH10404.1 hypothetical protein DVB88_17905 [Tsukamurella pulmonis]